MLAAFLTTILFSISAVCAQRTTKALGGMLANFWRVILATALLAVWAHLYGQGLSGPALSIYFLSGCIGFGFGDVALYQALPRLGSRLSILIVHCVAAPIAAGTEWFWLGTPLTLAEIVSAVVILMGVALALAPSGHLHVSRKVFWTGISLAFLAAVGQAMGAVLSRKANEVAAAAGQPVDGLTAAYQRIWGGVLIGVLFLLARRLWGDEKPTKESGPKPKRVWPWVVANALAGPALGVGCYQWALLQRGTGVVLPIVAITPLVIIPFSRLVEGERPQARSLMGGLLAVLGAVALALVS